MCPSDIPADDRYETLIAPIRPVIARIGEGALDRERAETPAHEQLGWLVDAGFARWRTPESLGGPGARLSDLFRAVAEIAEVDPNLAHVWRNHLSFVEDRVHALADAVAPTDVALSGEDVAALEAGYLQRQPTYFS